MLKAERMSKLTVIGPKTVMEDVIGKLHELRVYHIVDHRKTEALDIGAPTEKSEGISEALVRVRALCSSLGISGKHGRLPQKDISAIKKRAGSISSRLEKCNERLKSASEKERDAQEKKALLEKVNSLGLEPSDFHDYTSISYAVGIMPKMKDLYSLKREMNSRTSKNKVFSGEHADRTVLAVFFEAGKKDSIMELLGSRGFSEIDVTGIKGLKGGMMDNIKALRKELSMLEREKKDILDETESMKKEETDFLLGAEGYLSMEAEKAEAPLRFASTEKAFVIQGWVPAGDLQKTTKELNMVSNEKIYIESEPIRKDESIPIKLKNPWPVGFYEWFMDLYTLPTYREIDPTFLMFLTFPLFYGFMLGDVGYGLVTLTLFMILRARIKGDFGRLVNAMILASISAMVFGVLFAEYFGVELYHPILVNRMHDTEGLLIMAIAIGAVHVNIGLLVGFYNELMAHGFKAAFFEKLSWIVLEAGVALLVFAYTDVLNGYSPVKPLPWVGYAVIALSIAMIYKGEGAKGLVEIPALFSHMLSYARLMAVGLASVILAFVINDLAGGMFSAGILGIIGGTILLVVGHGINIALGLISPFLHSLRLHYVEFFTKFYHGGGMRYVPFGTRHEE